MPKRVGKYEIGKTLGEGTFGKVKYAVNTETGGSVAIKILDKASIQQQNMGEQIKKEISIMKMIKHPAVVNLHEVLASRSKIFIVLEFISGGELFDKIVDAGKFDETKAQYYFHQMVGGVAYCHDQGVYHRDLKPENLLLTAEDDLKISDFGLSSISIAGTESVSQLLHTTCGTPNYVAPEVLADKGYDGQAADVWSLGVILYVLLAGFLPFDEPTMSGLFRKIQKGDFQFPPWFSPEAKDLIGKILVVDPAKRFQLKDVQAHKWYTAGQSKADAQVANIDQSKADVGAAIQGGATEMGQDREDSDTPSNLNAFDLINLVGGMAFDHMLNYHDKNKKDRGVWRRYYTFMSDKPAKVIMERLIDLFTKDAGSTIEKVNNKSYCIKVDITNKATVTMNVQVYVILDSLHMVEVRRARGDILIYYKYLARIVPQMKQLIGPDSKVGETKAA